MSFPLENMIILKFWSFLMEFFLFLKNIFQMKKCLSGYFLKIDSIDDFAASLQKQILIHSIFPRGLISLLRLSYTHAIIAVTMKHQPDSLSKTNPHKCWRTLLFWRFENFGKKSQLKNLFPMSWRNGSSESKEIFQLNFIIDETVWGLQSVSKVSRKRYFFCSYSCCIDKITPI